MKAALLIEEKDKDGNPIVLVYHIAVSQMTMEREFDRTFNIFEGTTRLLPHPVRISVDGYLSAPTPSQWNGPMPTEEQKEIEPTNKAIEPINLTVVSNEDEDEIIVIDENDIEDHWRED